MSQVAVTAKHFQLNRERPFSYFLFRLASRLSHNEYQKTFAVSLQFSNSSFLIVEFSVVFKNPFENKLDIVSISPLGSLARLQNSIYRIFCN
ncbi:hypothetical protein RIR_jg35798.t1 [Rhizophagus irregularis DAOM 181602=DAOM 197198]|nr:hypothetical protein RIR_jg35798.t1 [Rhizophagus irregularis DAOM 181602=DAOM 197198]